MRFTTTILAASLMPALLVGSAAQAFTLIQPGADWYSLVWSDRGGSHQMIVRCSANPRGQQVSWINQNCAILNPLPAADLSRLPAVQLGVLAAGALAMRTVDGSVGR